MLAHKEYVGLHEVPGGALNINQVISGVSRISGRLFGIGLDFWQDFMSDIWSDV